jgi:hypothetical protein
VEQSCGGPRMHEQTNAPIGPPFLVRFVAA